MSEQKFIRQPMGRHCRVIEYDRNSSRLDEERAHHPNESNTHQPYPQVAFRRRRFTNRWKDGADEETGTETNCKAEW